MAKKDNTQTAGQADMPETATIETVEQLREAYPDLVAQIEKEAIAKAAAAGSRAMKKVPGFELEIDDPFGDGALRAYAAAAGIDPPRLPFVLPYANSASKPALESYMLRADGAGDTVRAEMASKALAKCQ